MIRWFSFASMRWQIFLLAIVPVVLSISVAFILGFATGAEKVEREQANLVAGNIILVSEQIQGARDDAGQADAFALATKLGLKADPTRQQDTKPFDLKSGALTTETRTRLADEVLALYRRIRKSSPETDVEPVLDIQLDSNRILAIRLPQTLDASSATDGLLNYLIATSLFMLALLLITFRISYRITAPLIEFTAAARRVSLDDTLKEPFTAEGASEIRSLGESLNAMRDRIGKMAEDRTSMLKALGHDLRTPLTRLRMRTERLDETELRRQMLLDIGAISAMIKETMVFLNDPSKADEPSRKVDLSSLLQTIAADYSDVGVSVSFDGPRRLVQTCKPQALTRAISNLIDNAARYASCIDLALCQDDGPGIAIEIRDNGPGLSDTLKKKVMEPFYKADAARTVGARGGFGLGLPIASGIVRAHGGILSLRDNAPGGLVVHISLPADAT
jgi:signal transduction histidine kinase